MMKKQVAPKTAEGYVSTIVGWQRSVVDNIRSCALRVEGLTEAIKWGHLVYESNGPVFLIRSENSRVLFGFWRGKRLLDIEPTLKLGGKYEMARIEILDSNSFAALPVEELINEAVRLNVEYGDPRNDAKKR